MHRRRSHALATLRALLATLLLLAACTTSSPSPEVSSRPGESNPVSGPAATPTPAPSPTPVPEVDVPLAVVTGYTNPIASLSEEEVRAAIEADTIVQACELVTAVNPVPRCLDAADANDDGAVDVSDAVAMMRGLFQDVSAFATPGPRCGEDPTGDGLGSCVEESCASSL